MRYVMDSPVMVFGLSFVVLWSSAQLGSFFHKKVRPIDEAERPDFDLILTATLTLLGLIIAFSFSMVLNRYDQRKNYEEEEANAIGTEYVRADLLPATDASKVHALLRSYLEQRIRFYEEADEAQLRSINAQTAQLQTELWSVVQLAAAQQPTPTLALAVSGMNDVLNSQGYTQAAWSNRVPNGSWGLLIVIAIGSCWLSGYDSRRGSRLLLLTLPLVISMSFFLLADINSPRHGLIRVLPQNLISLSEQLRQPAQP